MSRIARIGAVYCEHCEFRATSFYINYEKPETGKCPECGEALAESGRSQKKAILPGGFAVSPDEELYIRPDKENAARRWYVDSMRWERLEEAGKTKKLDDWGGRKAQIREWQKAGDEL